MQKYLCCGICLILVLLVIVFCKKEHFEAEDCADCPQCIECLKNKKNNCQRVCNTPAARSAANNQYTKPMTKCEKCLACAKKYPSNLGTIGLINEGCYSADSCSACGEVIHGNMVSIAVPKFSDKNPIW